MFCRGFPRVIQRTQYYESSMISNNTREHGVVLVLDMDLEEDSATWT